MENISGWKSSKKNRTNIIIGDENNPTQFSGGEVIINKKATKKNLKRLEEINDDGSGKTTTDASDGGLLSGPSHDNGGIPGIVGGVRQIETEGDEFVVSQEASEKHWKELSAINQSTGGVAINKPSGADDDPEEYKDGGKIKFQANKLPNKRILNYAEKIKAEYPKVWDLGGNIFGNQAFKNLKRVSDRGFWLDSEEWMFIKWRSYVARHQKDFRIEGVIAMLKWVDTVDRGWAYMKNLIDAEVKKRYPKKMKTGGSVSQTPALPPLVKKDALDIVLKGGSWADLDKLRNPNKKSYTLASDQIYEDFGNALAYAILNGLMTKDNLTSTNYQSWAYGYSILFKDKAGIEEMIEEGNFDKYIKQKLVDPIRVNEILKSVGIDNKTYKTGGRTIAQTPAPKNDRIKGSKVNPDESSESLSKASSIKFSAKTLSSIKSKVEEHNQKHPDKKITLASAKAVVRRGMGAYSSTHRPTIGGGKPNDRTAWGLARLNAFTYKIVHGKSKSGKYTQDDDLINELGYSVSKYHLGGDMSKHLAPNGKPSNLNHEQWHLVRTPEFKAWFGDWENNPENSSKVIDENGEPLVVYHGTNSEFYYFDKNSESNTYGTSQGFQGFFFTKSKGRSGDYALSKQDLKGGDAIVISAFLSLKNPNIKDAKNQSWVNVYPEQIDNSFDNKNDGVITYNILDGATSYSYWNNNPDDNYIAFEPNQIKLADGSNTTFDGNNPDIRFKDGGELDDPSKIFSASSRFRPAETIFFDPALVGPNGNKLISYTWKYQWTVDFNKTKGEEFEKRVSDWTQAEESAETGRNIVHAYTIEKPNGEVVTVSSESVPVLMGLIDREQKKVFANLATASKTLAKQQMKLAILEAQQKEYEDAKRAIIDAGYPEITIKPGWDETDVVLVMGDGTCHSDADNPFKEERVRCVQDNYVMAELSKRGIDPYKSDVSYQIGKLKPLIDRQKRKVENIIATEKMANGGSVNHKDTVTVDIPLMIRLLELSREDIHSDAELHMVVERLLNLKNKPILTMDDYAYIAEIEHKHLKKMALGGNIENEKLISQAHTNLTMKRGRRDYAPTTAEIQEEIDRMIMEEQFGSTNI